MTIQTVEQNNIICAVINSNEKVFTDAQSALDVLMTAKYDAGTKNIVIDKKLIIEDFFILFSVHKENICFVDITSRSAYLLIIGHNI